MTSMQLIPIAEARNGFTDKFGIPRQPQEDSVIETRIVFLPDYRIDEALRGIDGFSHLWLLWGFHDRNSCGWHPTVRPPRLGGNTRMGVFATRSPYRPNPIGLSSVRLLRIEKTGKEGTVLVVSGADLLDGTPIYDIKPYLAYSDSHPDACDGFASDGLKNRLPVIWLEGTRPDDETRRRQWEEILCQNPRPAYQHDSGRVYRISFAGEEAAFRVEDGGIMVESRSICQTRKDILPLQGKKV